MTESPAERVFQEFVRGRTEVSPEDEAALCREHPALADELRRMIENWRLIGALEGGVSVDELGRVEGEEDDLGLNELLDRLARVRRGERSRYRDGEMIGRGGMGEVRRVFDEDLRRVLAVKVARADDRAPSRRALVRFLEEAQVTSQLDHPGIVPVHELGVDEGGSPYFTMKLVRGEDLSRILARVRDGDDEWSTTRLLGVLLRAAEAMSFAHSRHVIHRDLKPANIMVGGFGETYVMDWGLAKPLGADGAAAVERAEDEPASVVLSDRREAEGDAPDSPLLTRDGELFGTPAYMAPEQARGHADLVGPPADVYAMGAILYQLLAGHMPYVPPGARPSPEEVHAAVLSGPPESLAERASDAPAELVAICEKAMARDRTARYPTMGEFAEDLRSFLENRVVAAYETGAWAELRKWVRRNKALAATAAASVLIVTTLASWAYVRIRDERDVAVAREQEVRRLSDKRRLEELVAEADELWPAHPEKLVELRGWLVRADALLGRLPLHEGTLAEVRSKGDRESPSEVSDLEASFDFGDDVETGWWHDAVRDLVGGLHALQADDVHGATVAGIEARLAWAEKVAERTTTGAGVAAQWAKARVAIKDHPNYGGLDLKPQIGLVPLGSDPDSTLWEFGHAQSGDVPVRNPDTGTFAVTEDTGLILVLIPGGEYRMGAQRIDPEAPHYDPQAESSESPVHDVTLDPYFLSKYEMTRGQWASFTGKNPSWYHSTSVMAKYLRHPVELVSWEMCQQTLSRLGLLLPTEAQWEAACRAGTDTPWSTGRERDSLKGAANLADQAAKRAEASWPTIKDWPELDDGFAAHAPVGSYRPNGFGLHDIHGNVGEWCRDIGRSDLAYGNVIPNEGDGLRVVFAAANGCIIRGGSFDLGSSSARSANRAGDSPGFQFSSLGLRPARALDR